MKLRNQLCAPKWEQEEMKEKILTGIAYQKFLFSYILIVIFLERKLPLFIQVTRIL
jgi:hypothetical protein